MRATGWLLIFACAALLLAHAQEEVEGGSTRTILAVEQAWSEAEARGDKRTLDRIFDNAVVYIEDGSLLTKGECLLRLRSAGSHLRQIEAGTALVHIFGSTAIVVGTYREIGVNDGKTVLRRWRFIDTWVNKKGSWVLVAAGSAPLIR